jgi:hypothetical protein
MKKLEFAVKLWTIPRAPKGQHGSQSPANINIPQE